MLSPPAIRCQPLLGMIALVLLMGCGEARPPLASAGPVHPWADADVVHGRQLVQDYGCVACHTVPGVRAPASRVGPTLDKMALRAYVGGVLANTPDNLLRWLLDPPAVDPRTTMPNVGLSVAEAQDIAAYLLTLH
ncbi:MAG: c-type cytochrome [Candidimonas sp.]|nr:c-type cytochrome [Candidimonas sp.]